MYNKKEYHKFAPYLIYYACEDEPDFDGVHDGGVKGISADAPEEAVKAYEAFKAAEAEAKRRGIKI